MGPIVACVFVTCRLAATDQVEDLLIGSMGASIIVMRRHRVRRWR